MSQHNEVGKIGEEIARKYLEEKGYKIIEQNYKTKYAEIDLVATKDKVLSFVEVRTKVGEFFGTPEETINHKKMRKLLGNTMAYVSTKKWNGSSRIDAICIVLSAQGGSALGGKSTYVVERLNHYENILG